MNSSTVLLSSRYFLKVILIIPEISAYGAVPYGRYLVTYTLQEIAVIGGKMQLMANPCDCRSGYPSSHQPRRFNLFSDLMGVLDMACCGDCALRVAILGGRTTGFHQFPIMGPIMEGFLTKAGFCVELTEDRDILLADRIKEYDVVVDYTTGEKLNQDQVGGLLGFVAGGGGFVGIHCAADSFKENHEYISMLGGRFITHPPHQELSITVVDHEHPITKGISDFKIQDELYMLEYDPAPLHILMECHFQDKVMPVAWVRPYGKGRVYYLSLGHGPEAHNNPAFQELLIRGINWAAGRL